MRKTQEMKSEAYNKDMVGTFQAETSKEHFALPHGRTDNQVVGRFANSGNLAPVEGFTKV